MAKHAKSWILGCVFLLGAFSTAQALVVDFESFSDSESLVSQVAGLTFSNATVLSAGVS